MHYESAGATAFDLEDGDLTHRILTCPPPECMPFGCPGHELRRKGIQGCGADTATAAVGTLLTFDFVVLDHSVPPAVSRESRLIRVTSPCAAAEIYCPDLEAPYDCGSSDCVSRAELVAAQPPADEPPYLNFTAALPPALIANGSSARAAASLADIPESLLSALGERRVSSIGHVAVRCGAAMPVPLSVCVAPGAPAACVAHAWHADASNVAAGWAFAVSPVTDPACTTERMQSGACAACTAEAALIGGCLPGMYAFALRAQAPNGLWSDAQIAVAVAVQAAVVSGEVGVRVTVRTSAHNGTDTGASAAEVEERLENTLGAAGQSGVSEVALAVGSAMAEALTLHDGACSLGPFENMADAGSVVVDAGTTASPVVVASSVGGDGRKVLMVRFPATNDSHVP